MAHRGSTQEVKIFDTTLRDGEQSPGCSMTLDQKMEIALALQKLGVDVIEAGFPIASPGDFESVASIAREVRRATICGLARCCPEDIDRAWDAVQPARHPRIHVFLATSAIHRENKLGMSKEEVIRRAVAGVERAKGYCDDIEFSPEDAVRTEIDFLCKVVRAAIAAGATTVNIPDTVGYATPTRMHNLIHTLRQRVPNIRGAVISVHCHNDLGLATANSLAAVEAGAGQIECTINGIGERAGNCALEEVVMAMRTRQDVYRTTTNIRTKRLVEVSDLVERHTIPKQRNKAIVGKNAFAHEAGIHQDGFLKERSTYEIIRPQDVGRKRSDLVLGKHSGTGALTDRLYKRGMPLSADDRITLRERFKTLADEKIEHGRGKYVTDEELLEEVYFPMVEELTGNNPFIVSVRKERTRRGKPASVVITTRDGKTIRGVASGQKEGAIDAFVCGMRTVIPNLDVPAGGLNLTNPIGGSAAPAEITATLTNGCTVSRTVRETDSADALLDAHIAACNTLIAIGEYGETMQRKPKRAIMA
ncbi:MAG: 2-isopropylmalate synthase [Candidatus Peregrinibacteria bacterium]